MTNNCECAYVPGDSTHEFGCPARYWEEMEMVSNCPVCGEPIDYCTGHGEMGDPHGHQTLIDHDNGNHDNCHPNGCEDKEIDLGPALVGILNDLLARIEK